MHREKGWNAGGQVAWFADWWKSRVSTASLEARGKGTAVGRPGCLMGNMSPDNK